jgi:hypothetical protein
MVEKSRFDEGREVRAAGGGGVMASPAVDEVELEDPRANASVMLCSTSAAAGSE